MSVVCRPARMEDLERADEIVVASINELTERRGFGKMASFHPPNFQAFSLRDKAEGLWVADDDACGRPRCLDCRRSAGPARKGVGSCGLWKVRPWRAEVRMGQTSTNLSST
jgi:hypothetical protein